MSAVKVGDTIVFKAHHDLDSNGAVDHRVVYSPRYAGAHLDLVRNVTQVNGNGGFWPKAIWVRGTVKGFWWCDAAGNCTSISAGSPPEAWHTADAAPAAPAIATNATAAQRAAAATAKLAADAAAGRAGYTVEVGGSNFARFSALLAPGPARTVGPIPSTKDDWSFVLSDVLNVPMLLGSDTTPATSVVRLSVPKKWVSTRLPVLNDKGVQVAPAQQTRFGGWPVAGVVAGVEPGWYELEKSPGPQYAYAPSLRTSLAYATASVPITNGTFVVYRGTVCVVESAASTAGSYVLATAVRSGVAAFTTRETVAANQLIVLPASRGWAARVPAFAVGTDVVCAGAATKVRAVGYTYTLTANSPAATSVNKYVAGYYATEIQKALKAAPNYTAMDMMLYEAATKDGVLGTGVTYELASAPGTYRASSAVSAPFAVGTWVEFEVHSSYHNGTGNDFNRLVYAPGWFDSNYRGGSALTASVKARGVVRGTWSSSAGKGGYSIWISLAIANILGMLHALNVHVPYTSVLGAVSGQSPIVLVGPAITASPPLRRGVMQFTSGLRGKIMVYHGAYCVVIGLGENYTVDILTLLPADAPRAEVSALVRGVSIYEIVEVPSMTSRAYTEQIKSVGARLATTGGRVTAVRATFRGLPTGSMALYNALASAGAAERTKTGAMPTVPYYGQIDSMLAAIPTESERIECGEVTYPNTELPLAAPETVAVGGVVIYRGRTWVVTGRPTDLPSQYNLREAIASHITPLAPPEDAHYVDPSDLVPTQWTASIVEETATLPRWDERSAANYVVWQPPGMDAACEVGYITDNRYTYAVAGASQRVEHTACYRQATTEVEKPRPNYASLNSRLAGMVWSAGPAVAVYMGYTIQNRQSQSVLEKQTTVVKRDRSTTRGVRRDQIWTEPLIAEVGARLKLDLSNGSTYVGEIVQVRYPQDEHSATYAFRGDVYAHQLVGRSQSAHSSSSGPGRQLVYLAKFEGQLGSYFSVAIAPIGADSWEKGYIRLA